MTAIRFLEPYARSLLRIAVGFTISFHGMQKLLGLFGGMGPSGGTAELFSLAWVAGLLELGGGVLLFLGLFTPPVAFILSGEMAVAYFKAHYPRGFFPIRNGGELAVLYCFVFFYLFLGGAGPVSLDRLLRGKT